jgi:hypothetical protein
MADNDYRSYRNRDAGAPQAASARTAVDDPLAELARLIGQGDPVSDHGQAYDDAPQGGVDWASDRYAEPRVTTRQRDEPRAPEPYPSYTPRPVPPRHEDYERPNSRQSAPAPRFSGRDDPHDDYAVAGEPRYRDDPPPVAGSRPRPSPALAPDPQAAQYEHDEAYPGPAEDRIHALEDFEDGPPRRRRGLVVVAAVLGLAALGTAGAFGYRAMFGGSILPSLPPIIKAEEGPNKIVPSTVDARGGAAKPAKQADTAGSGEKLVSHEEKPVDVPAPVTTAPRVVSTVPIFPAPTPDALGAPPPMGAPAMNTLSTAMPAPAAQTPLAQAPAVPTPATPIAPAPAMPPPTVTDQVSAQPPLPQPPGSKKVHTVTIRADQPNAASADAAAPAAPPSRAAAPAPRPAAPPAPRAASSNAPLEIAPPSGDAAPQAAPRTRTAVARQPPAAPAPSGEATASASGGYAVQVTSQRSEAEAQSAYRELAARYPGQLGGHSPIIRRADLGGKGVFYRALVGPYASMEQAAEVCSSLKAAGGSCIVQKN